MGLLLGAKIHVETKCDVCGRVMRQWPVAEPPHDDWSVDSWGCPWCHALTFRHVLSGKIERTPYAPLSARWERVVSRLIGSNEVHARGFVTSTLCGIEADDMLSDDSIMWNPAEAAACQACRAEAVLIDSRWPANRRDPEDRKREV